MSRKRFLVAYDISNEKRLRRVFATMNGFGDHIQYSVFMCELSARERIEMESKLRKIVHATEDQVLVMDLGTADREANAFVASIGRDFSVPSRVLVI